MDEPATDGSVTATVPTTGKQDNHEVHCAPKDVDSDKVPEVKDTTETRKSDTMEAQQTSCNRKAGYAAIKKEFLVPDYKPTLQTEYLSSEMKKKMDSVEVSNNEKNANDEGESLLVESDGEDESEPPSKKAKLKGRNKHRPRNEKIHHKDRMCPAIKDNRECKFGDNCKFNHDKKDFVSKKLPDLEGPCYNFSTFGSCSYGIACRFAKNHITEDMQNITNQELYEKMKSCKPLNELSPDVRQKLWKKKYDFRKADKVVRDVQKNFRGVDHSTVAVKVEDSKKEGSFSPTVSEQNSVPSISDGVLKPDSDRLHTNSVQNTSNENLQSVNKPEVTDTGKAVSSSLDGKRTLGCITDEEIIPLRPQEKVKIDLKNKLYLAPLTTVGNLPFRRVCKELGAEVTCGEMALVPQLLKAKQSEWSLVKRHPCEDIFGVQICGFNAESMTRCAQLLTETCSVDFIDVNCGCPIDMVYKKGGGSALMGKATKLEQMCRSMIGVMGDTPLTVKVRTGVFDNKSVAHQIIPRLRDAGVSLVTIHGRSREQRYTKQADWDYIAQCAAAGAPMPVFGNGDILSFEEANLHMEHSGVSGIMIARGALIKPWIFTEIKEQRHWDISSGERFDMLRKYTNYGLEHWGSDHQGVENTRRFMLEWLSFLHRYIPVGVLEQVPQHINERPPYYIGRNDLETLMASANCADWVKISEMLLGPVPPNFQFLPKHKANAYQ